MFNTILSMIGLNLDELIDEIYNDFINKKYIHENIDLITRSLERADSIFQAQYMAIYIYFDDTEHDTELGFL
jgi:hypothetical protein